jgi:hypothetical protein
MKCFASPSMSDELFATQFTRSDFASRGRLIEIATHSKL